MKSCSMIKTLGELGGWSKGVSCWVLYLSESFHIKKVLQALHVLLTTLSSCEWFKPEISRDSSREVFSEHAAGYTAPAQQPLIIRQPKEGQENFRSPLGPGQVQADVVLLSLV